MLIDVLECGLCGRAVASNRMHAHHSASHRFFPFDYSQYRPSPLANYFIKCKLCALVIMANPKDKEFHWMKRHGREELSKLFDDKQLILDRWWNCEFCRKNIRESAYRSHLKEMHPTESKTEDVETNNTQPIETGPPDVEENDLLEELFVRCEYCGGEFLPEQLDDHVQQEHVTDIEDNDDDEDETISISSHASKANQQTDGKVAAKHIKCEHCSKRIRLEKMDKHIRRKHSTKKTKSDRKRKSSVSSVDVVNGSNDESKSVSNDGEKEFYTIYVSKNELQKFLNANRIYPKDGQFHLKDTGE